MALQRQLLAELVEFAPDAMLIVDGAGTILYANERVSELFGSTHDELMNNSVDILLPERFRARHSAHRRLFAEDRRPRPMGAGFDLLGRRADGTEFPVEISLNPLQGGLIAAAIRDVTDRKHAERELIKARESADAAREEADRANLAKSRFLATASHDLRQPLQAIAMLHGTLRRRDVDATVREILDQQGQALDTMRRLLNALLDISKLESGAIKPQPCAFALAPIFQRLRTEFAAAATAKGIELIVESTSLCVRTDPTLVEQMLRNLLTNGIKYTKDGGVTLSARPIPSGVRVEIRDTGIGIPNDQLGFIFEEFFQVGVASNASRDGYGLGLAIVQRIAKLLELRIDVRTQVGKGSTFSLELPETLAPPNEPFRSTSDSGLHPMHRAQSRQVLVTEDEPSVLRATRLLLELEGYRVITATNRDEAVARAREIPHLDVMVSDYHLREDQTGFDAILAVRAQLGREIPAVLVTGDTSSAMRKLPTMKRLRLTSKPVDADELLRLIDELQGPVSLTG